MPTAPMARPAPTALTAATAAATMATALTLVPTKAAGGGRRGGWKADRPEISASLHVQTSSVVVRPIRVVRIRALTIPGQELWGHPFAWGNFAPMEIMSWSPPRISSFLLHELGVLFVTFRYFSLNGLSSWTSTPSKGPSMQSGPWRRS